MRPFIKILQSLRKKKWIACFLPDNEEEEALVQITVPLRTPIPVDQVRRDHPGLFAAAPPSLRYETAETTPEEETGDDPVLQEIVDLYFNNVSMKMNSFILDELRLIRRRFEMSAIRKIFHRAKDHGIQSMGWVLRELHREVARKKKKEPKKSEESSS